MRSTDFFIEEEDPVSRKWVQRLNEDLLNSLQIGPIPDTSDVSAAAGLLDLIQDELTAYGTGGGQRLDDANIAVAIRALEAVTRRLGMPVKLPIRDFTRFRSYWTRNGAHGSWQARRDIIDELLEPPRLELARIEAGARPQLPVASIANLRDPTAIQEQLGRIQRAVVDDPALAIGSAKELIESTAKTVLIECSRSINDKDDLPALVSQAQQALGLHPSSATPGPDGTDAVKKILGAVITVTLGLAELRNRGYGTGHGASGVRIGLRPRHAHLAVNASITWCQLMLDTLADQDAPWHRAMPPDG